MLLNTSFDEIYHLFLSQIQDYNLRNLLNNNIDIAQDMLKTFLLRSIPKFANCTKRIMDIDDTTDEFPCKLDLAEKNILSELMVCTWLDWVINDIRQISLHLQDNDFKTFSEESNLKQKSEYCDRVREKASQDMVEYGLRNTPFDKWAVGDYGV